MTGRKLGQHFLKDHSIAKRIIELSYIKSGVTVVEVGPGWGALTDLLAECSEQLLLIEKDEMLAQKLQKRFGKKHNIRIFTGDVRSFDMRKLMDGELTAYKVVSNLPYYAASRIISHFLKAEHKPIDMVVMVQKEVAENIAASPGSMRFLSLLVQSQAKTEILFNVPPVAFSPPPKVQSTVLRISPLQYPILDFHVSPLISTLAKAAFNSRRKTLRNSISAGMRTTPEFAANIITSAGIDPSRRPATLSLEEWQVFHNKWKTFSLSQNTRAMN